MGPAHGRLMAAAGSGRARPQGPPRPHPLLRVAPALTLAAFLLPIGAGLAGTLLPAIGWLPALGGTQVSLAPWQALAEAPGFAGALRLTLTIGGSATALSLLLAVLAVAALQHRPVGRRLGEWMAPLLAMPHSALAIGLAFLILPSGWLVRAVSPALTGWSLPPDVSTVGHASGWPVVLALLLKEVPYLVLMILGALNQVPAAAEVRAARALGYGPAQAWLAVVLPQVLAQIRLPVLAVLAFSLSVVDVALVLGPDNPPTLAVLAVRWMADPDPRWVFPASAAATLLLGLVAASLLLWRALEAALFALLRRWAMRGVRRPAVGALAAGGAALGAVLLVLAGGAMLALALWSVATQWRWPAAWPAGFTLDHWQRQSAALLPPAWTTLALGAAATAIALALVLACLENEAQRRRGPARGLWLLYLPLLVPQVAFLFGLQVLLVRLRLDGRFGAVLWAHLVFVLPYLFLSLADAWRAYDERYTRSALALGAARWRVFWRVKLPILLPPVLLACAVGFAVSVGQYLPTLFAGAGRVATLTTEAVTLSAGADRRVIGTWALLQAAFPLVVYAAAVLLPRALRRPGGGGR
jgi:putative thiamine transport system permease protein